jgi:hypothetical protein
VVHALQLPDLIKACMHILRHAARAQSMPDKSIFTVVACTCVWLVSCVECCCSSPVSGVRHGEPRRLPCLDGKHG